ncbi:MAG: AAA family ATPase [Gemmatimonadaceae bacterium]
MLLDEIEKAHPDVFNILLQVLDEDTSRQLRPRDRLQEHGRDHDVERRRKGHHEEPEPRVRVA